MIAINPGANDMRGSTRGLTAAIAVVALVALTACAADDSGSDSGGKGGGSPYVVGFNDDLSGPIAVSGTTGLAGFQTYFDYLNKSQGGINGHRIEVKVLDTRADGATSIANYKQLVDEGAIVVGGNSASAAWAATGPLASQLKVPQIGFGSADAFFTTYDPYMFKTSMPLAQQVSLMGDVVSNYLFKGKTDLRIALNALDTASGPPYIDAVKALAKKKGWTIVASQSTKAGATDCSAQAAVIAASKPDVVLGSQSTGEDVVCFNQLTTDGYKGPVVNDWFSPGEATMRTLHSDRWITLRMYNWWDDPTNAGTKTMQQQAVKYGHIGQFGAFSSDGYMSAVLIAAAIKTCGDDCTGEKVATALEKLKNVDSNGIAGPALGYTKGDNGHIVPQARFFVWDAATQHSKPYTDWLCLPGRCSGAAASPSATPAK